MNCARAARAWAPSQQNWEQVAVTEWWWMLTHLTVAQVERSPTVSQSDISLFSRSVLHNLLLKVSQSHLKVCRLLCQSSVRLPVCPTPQTPACLSIDCYCNTIAALLNNSPCNAFGEPLRPDTNDTQHQYLCDSSLWWLSLVTVHSELSAETSIQWFVIIAESFWHSGSGSSSRCKFLSGRWGERPRSWTRVWL